MQYKGSSWLGSESANQGVNRIDEPTCSLITEWLTTEEAASFLRISKGSLLNLSSNGKVPYYKWQRRNRYKKAELRELLLQQKRGSHGN